MMKQKILPIFTVLILLVCVAVGGHRNISDILGATHMNPQYNFTSAPVLEEGADVLRHLGSRTIKLWYGPDYKINFPQNHNWPTVTSCTELAQTEYFQTMFGDPDFLVYSLELATFDSRYGWQYGDFNASESNLVFTEVYDLTEHLLSAYNNSGKTFILQNWEGDNALGQNASAQKVQSMIDWLNCRQDAINAAVADSTASNVWVYGAAECNKVGQPDWEGARCITDVFPFLHMDLYSYSDWYTRYEEDLLLEDLNTIKRHAPDSPAFGHENVMLGEFGLNRTANGEAGNLLSSRTELEIGLDVGARYALYWCVYDTQTNKSHGLVLNEEYADKFGLPVDHTGRYFTQTHHYFKTNALTLDVFEDLGEDLSLCSSSQNMVSTNDVQEWFDNDPSLYVRPDKQPGILEYVFDRDVRRLAVMGYEQIGKVTTLTVSASKTGESGSYVDIPLRKIINDSYPGTDFRRMLFKNVDAVPAGFRYFNVVGDSNVQQSPQIGSVRFYLERPPIIETIQFGGLVSHLSDTNHQAQVGADELVQFNGADSWGGATGLNGNLNNGDVGAFVTSPATGLKLTTTLATSNTAVNGSSGVIGIKGGDNAKFDPARAEQWGLEFDRPVILRQLLIAAVTSDEEEVSIEINGIPSSFTRIDPNAEISGWSANRFIYSFDPPVELAAGTDLTVGALTTGQFGLEGIVVQSGALATDYDLWAKTQGLEGTDADWFADPDGNGMDNQLDYALGGIPPVSAMVQADGSNVVEMVFQRRRDAAARGLDYRIQWTDNLVSNIWNTAFGAETDVVIMDESFEIVTNQVPADLPSKFIRLDVEAAK